MDDKTLTRLLDQLAADALPPATDLWPAVQAQANLKGPHPMTPTSRPAARLRWAGLTTVAVLALAAAFLLLPQGRALAQSVWLFFNPAAAESFAVPTEMTTAGEPSTGPTAEPPSFAADQCGADLACQLAAAEAATGLSARELPATPKLSFTYVQAFPETGTLILGYTADGGGGLVLSQSRGDLPTSPWEAVPEGAAQAVTVNGAAAEYVEGTFVVFPGSDEAVWNADAPVQRLRWQANGTLYELSKLGDPQALEYLDQAAMIALAEQLQ